MRLIKWLQALDAALKSLKKAPAVMGFSVNEETGKVTIVAKVDKVYHILVMKFY